MGQANLREFFAKTDTLEGFKPQTLTAGTAVSGEGFNVVEHSAAKAVVALAFTTATGAEGDTYTLQIEAESADTDDFVGAESLKVYDHVIVADDNDGAHSAVVLLPTKLIASKLYCRFKVTFSADGDNTGTASAIIASLNVEVGGNITDPQEAYDRDGYGKVTIAE